MVTSQFVRFLDTDIFNDILGSWKHDKWIVFSLLVSIKKEITTGRRGGGSKWPLKVVQLVIEQLVNGTPPTSIRFNIASFLALSTTSDKIKQLPSLSFIRECRLAIQIIGETLTAYRLASAPKWEQYLQMELVEDKFLYKTW